MARTNCCCNRVVKPRIFVVFVDTQFVRARGAMSIRKRVAGSTPGQTPTSRPKLAKKGLQPLAAFYQVASKKCQLGCGAADDLIEAPVHLPCGPGTAASGAIDVSLLFIFIRNATAWTFLRCLLGTILCQNHRLPNTGVQGALLG